MKLDGRPFGAQGKQDAKGLSGDGVVAFEGVADVVGGDGAETADAPVIAA